MSQPKKNIAQQLVEHYREVINHQRPDFVSAWPIISGYNARIGKYGNWCVIILEHTGASNILHFTNLEVSRVVVDVEEITMANKASVRSRLERHFALRSKDGVVLMKQQENGDWDLADEFSFLIQKHEHSMGLVPMRVFLSHKGADKPLVREFKQSLELLGFAPWLDEDAMSAGAELERSILKGFEDSCAAVFFVTPNFQDEQFLATEVDYAIKQKRAKGEKFAIITLVLDNAEQTARVPELLHRFVWKEPQSQLEALREILKALPVQTGTVYWKNA